MSLSSASSCCHLAGQAPGGGTGGPAVPSSHLLKGASTEGWQVPALDCTEVPETCQLPASSPGLSSPAPGSVPSGGQGWGWGDRDSGEEPGSLSCGPGGWPALASVDSVCLPGFTPALLPQALAPLLLGGCFCVHALGETAQLWNTVCDRQNSDFF